MTTKAITQLTNDFTDSLAAFLCKGDDHGMLVFGQTARVLQPYISRIVGREVRQDFIEECLIDSIFMNSVLTISNDQMISLAGHVDSLDTVYAINVSECGENIEVQGMTLK